MNLKTNGRIQELDIIKGVLVIIMLFYHNASIASNTSPELNIIRQNISFIHSAFIIITGFLCGYYYFPKSKITPDNVRSRLRQRSGKIIGIFIVSNALLYSIVGIFNFTNLLNSLNSLSGFINNILISMNGSLFAFEILFYIAIFLFIASLFIHKMSVAVLFIFIFLSFFLSHYSNTVLFTGFGLVGMLIGVSSETEALSNFWKILKCHQWIPPILLIIYAIFFKTKLDHLTTGFPSTKLIVLSFETFLWFSSTFFFVRFFDGTKFYQSIILFGHYTLFAYLAQMLIIRIGYTVACKIGLFGFIYYSLNLIISTIILLCIVTLIDVLKTKYSFISKAYSFVFK